MTAVGFVRHRAAHEAAAVMRCFETGCVAVEVVTRARIGGAIGVPGPDLATPPLVQQPTAAISPELAARPARVSHPYLRPYREAIARLGTSFEALLYYSRDTQERRFEALAKVAPLAGRAVVDVGCGHADLLGWLERQGVFCRSYSGLDAFPEFIEQARVRVATAATAPARCEVVDFVDCDFERFVEAEPTTIVFSGSLNALPQTLACERLRAAFHALGKRSGNALVFNFLSRCASYRGDEDAHLRRFEATEMLEFALELTPLSVFCQHYLSGHDATIAMLVP